MTAWCADKRKQTATTPPKITWLSVDSIQPDVMDQVLNEHFLPKISPCSSESRWMESEDVGLTVRAISFQDFQPMWSWPTNIRDRRTDRWTDDKQSQDRSLHYSALRGKNCAFFYQQFKRLIDKCYLSNQYLNRVFKISINCSNTRSSTRQSVLSSGTLVGFGDLATSSSWFSSRFSSISKSNSIFCSV